jgi:ribosome modulation factor
METKAVNEGVNAYRAGIPRDACPYDGGTQDHIDWLRGWDKAEELDFEQLADSMTCQ